MNDELTRTAYHEAGHAVMAAFLGARVSRITVEPEYDDLPREGDTHVVWQGIQGNDREWAVREIKVALAGPVAEMIYDNNQVAPELLPEWAADWTLATTRAKSFLTDAAVVPAYLARMVHVLVGLFERDDVWAQVAALADELEAHGTLEWAQVEEVLQQWRIW